MKAAELAKAQKAMATFSIDASAMNRALRQVARAFEEFNRRFARSARSLEDLRFTAEGGRIYYVIATGNDGLTRRIKRRDYSRWRGPGTGWLR